MPKPSSLVIRDWLFSGAGKRKLLEALLRSKSGQAWQMADLARAAGLHPNGSVDVHLAALRQLGLVSCQDGEWRLVADSPFTRPLRALLRELERLPDASVEKPSG